MKNKTVSFVIKEFGLETPMFPVKIALTDDVLGQWFAASFDEINELMGGEAGAEFDIEKQIQQGIQMQQKLAGFDEILKETKLFSPDGEMTENDNYYQFKIKTDPKKVEKSAQTIAKFLEEMSPDFVEGFRAGIQEQRGLLGEGQTDFAGEIAALLLEINISGDLKVNKKDMKYFVFDGTITPEGSAPIPVVITNLEDNFSLSIDPSSTDGVTFSITGDDEKEILLVAANETVLSGKYKEEESFSLELLEGGEAAVEIAFDLDTDEAEMTGTIDLVAPGITVDVTIQDLEIKGEQQEIDLSGAISLEDLEVATFTLKSQTDYSATLSFPTVTETKPLQEFTQTIQELMLSVMGGGLPMDESYDIDYFPEDAEMGSSEEEALNELMRQLEAQQQLQVETEVNTETQVETTPNTNNQSDAEAELQKLMDSLKQQ